MTVIEIIIGLRSFIFIDEASHLVITHIYMGQYDDELRKIIFVIIGSLRGQSSLHDYDVNHKYENQEEFVSSYITSVRYTQSGTIVILQCSMCTCGAADIQLLARHVTTIVITVRLMKTFFLVIWIRLNRSNLKIVLEYSLMDFIMSE